MKSEDAQAVSEVHPALKTTLAQRITPQALMQHVLPLHKSNNPLPPQLQILLYL